MLFPVVETSIDIICEVDADLRTSWLDRIVSRWEAKWVMGEVRKRTSTKRALYFSAPFDCTAGLFDSASFPLSPFVRGAPEALPSTFSGG
jgi:hypothetical protein